MPEMVPSSLRSIAVLHPDPVLYSRSTSVGSHASFKPALSTPVMGASCGMARLAKALDPETSIEGDEPTMEIETSDFAFVAFTVDRAALINQEKTGNSYLTHLQ